MMWPPDIGVKPYYSDESVCIIHGDCREVLPRLSASPASIPGETSS